MNKSFIKTSDDNRGYPCLTLHESIAERLGLLPTGQEHVLQQEHEKAHFTKAVTDISRAFALCAAHDEPIRLRDDIAFFQAVQSALVKPCCGVVKRPATTTTTRRDSVQHPCKSPVDNSAKNQFSSTRSSQRCAHDCD
ncbi:MAG: DUF3387 domain-containing protein [Planctomycetia bacterium]|nr:DUF3387 domain-containing protein [Planctomycetia bacterium]